MESSGNDMQTTQGNVPAISWLHSPPFSLSRKRSFKALQWSRSKLNSIHFITKHYYNLYYVRRHCWAHFIVSPWSPRGIMCLVWYCSGKEMRVTPCRQITNDKSFRITFNDNIRSRWWLFHHHSPPLFCFDYELFFPNYYESLVVTRFQRF